MKYFGTILLFRSIKSTLCMMTFGQTELVSKRAIMSCGVPMSKVAQKKCGAQMPNCLSLNDG